MRLQQCSICKHQFEPLEHYIILRAGVTHVNGSGQDTQLAICQKHLSPEKTECDDIYQIYTEYAVFGD